MASSLHYVTPLQLSDTFNEWFLRSNDLIDVVNKINVYNVENGWGLARYRSIDGTTVLRINIGQQENEYDASGGVSSDWRYGLRFIDDAGTTGAANPDVSTSRKILTLDFENLPGPSGGISGASVLENDWYAFASSGGTAPVRRIAAQDMLPYGISGDHRFYGDIYFDGTRTVINSTDLYIDDKQIYMATSNTGDSTGGYLNDTNLDGAGFIIRGASGDKEFTYNYTTAVGGRTFSSFKTNVDLELSSVSKLISEDKNLDFFSLVDDDLDITLSQLNAEKIYWKIRKSKQSDSQGRLIFFHEDTSTAASNTALTLSKAGTVKIGELDGGITIDGTLHESSFSYLPAAYSVPTTGNSGDSNLHYKWANRKTVTQIAHGFSSGQCLRIYPSGTTYAHANWESKENAEVISVVEDHAPGGSHDQFTAVYGGLVDLSSWIPAGWSSGDGTTMEKGQVYFLSGASGGITASPPDVTGLIKKPVLLAVDQREALFVNYLGHEVSTGSVASAVTGDYAFYDTDNGGYLTRTATIPNQEFKNKIINGNFEFWQRAELDKLDAVVGGSTDGQDWDGTTGARFINDGGTIQYTADMWALDTRYGGMQAQVQKIGHTSGVDPIGNNWFTSEANGSFARILNITPLTDSKYTKFTHRIENCTTLQPVSGSGYATVSYYARGVSAAAVSSWPLRVSLWQVFNGNSGPMDSTGDYGGGATMCLGVVVTDDVAGTVSATGGSNALGSSWTRTSHTYILNDSASMTGGVAGAGISADWSWLELRFELPSEFGCSGGVDLARVQIEGGNEVTDWDERPIQVEELLTNRYYQKHSVGLQSYGLSAAAAGGLGQFNITPYPYYDNRPGNINLAGNCTIATDIITPVSASAAVTTDIKGATAGIGFDWERTVAPLAGAAAAQAKTLSTYHFDFSIYDT